MTLVILAAGLGSRYGGLKQLDPMNDAGNFIIDFSVYDAIKAGFDHVLFIIKEENLELFRETIGKRIEKKVKVTYAFQKSENLPAGHTAPEGRTKPLGTGHAIYCVRDLVQDSFAVINADDFYGRDAFCQLAAHLKKAEGSAHFCMVGYRLKNTLTENGTVSRGQCFVDANGMLEQVTERTKILKKETCAAYLAEDGETWIDLPFDTVVSMNCWGFTPALFENMESDFAAFLEALTPENEKTAEYFLPFCVDSLCKRGLCDVRVLPTTSAWLGVTYPEDKARVKSALKDLVTTGEYPAALWD